MDFQEQADVACPDPHLPPAHPIGPMSAQWLGNRTVSEDDKNHWINNGFLILRNVYSLGEIDRYTKIVTEVRNKINDGKDEYGYGDRIGQLHQKEPDLLRMAADPIVITFLKWAFNDDPVAFASLNFERGTQQEAHVDAIFFWPEPSYSMAGCWVALEDVHLDAGPLFYVPTSHTWPFYRGEHVASTRPDIAEKRRLARDPNFPADRRGAIANELGAAWTEDFKSLERTKQTERRLISLKAGDVVIWHSLLAHGGSPRINPALSRRSVVFHYIGKRTQLYTFEQFMLFDEVELKQQQHQPMDLLSYNGTVEYMRYPYFVTHTPEQVVHTL